MGLKVVSLTLRLDRVTLAPVLIPLQAIRGLPHSATPPPLSSRSFLLGPPGAIHKLPSVQARHLKESFFFCFHHNIFLPRPSQRLCSLTRYSNDFYLHRCAFPPAPCSYWETFQNNGQSRYGGLDPCFSARVPPFNPFLWPGFFLALLIPPLPNGEFPPS